MDIKTNHTTKYKLLFNNLGTELETQEKKSIQTLAQRQFVKILYHGLYRVGARLSHTL